MAAMNSRTMCLRAVFDHHGTAFFSECDYVFDLTRPTGEVDRKNRPRSIRNMRLYRSQRDVLRVSINIREYGRRANQLDDTGTGEERTWRDDDLVARTYTSRTQGQLEGHGTVGGGYGMLASAVKPKLLFELLAFLASPIVHFAG